MSLLPNAPRSIGGVLDDAIRLYRVAFAKCLPLILAATLLLMIPGLFLGYQMQGAMAVNPAAILSIFRSPAVWISYVGMIIVMFAVYGALIIKINALAHAEPLSLGAALIAGVKRIPSMIGMSILFVVFVSIGFVLLLIPGFYVWGILQLAFIPLLIDNTGVFESFGISRRLVKGNWWRSTTIVFVAFVILYILVLVVGMAAGFIAGFSPSAMMGNIMVQQVLSSIMNVFVMPFLPSVMLSIYYDLKLRNEGTDLEERIAVLKPVS